jgi:hypothetical protein
MNILILNRIPYYKIEYDRGIDHNKHNVTYIGLHEINSSIPLDLNCVRVERSGDRSVFDEVNSFLSLHLQQFDMLISLSEYELLDAARLREKYAISGPSVNQIEKVRNKALMKQIVSRYGIPTPSYNMLHDIIANPSLAANFTGPVILKPIYGASSEGVTKYKSINHCLHYISQKNGVDFNDYEVESFITGKIYHMDGLCHAGKVLVYVPSCYVGTCLDYANGSPLGSVQVNRNSVMDDFVRNSISAVGIREGAFHLEAIFDGEKFIFLEIANRVGGADIVRTFELKTGIHLPSAELQLLISNHAPQLNYKFTNNMFGWFVFPAHSFCSNNYIINYPISLKHSSYILEWHENRQAVRTNHITYQLHDSPLSGLVMGHSSDALHKFLCDVFSNTFIMNKYKAAV